MKFRFEIGDAVEWSRGAVGLAGTVIEQRILDGAEPEWREFYRIETPLGSFHEFSCNLIETAKRTFSFNRMVANGNT